jgi:hypothetical protein
MAADCLFPLLLWAWGLRSDCSLGELFKSLWQPHKKSSFWESEESSPPNAASTSSHPAPSPSLLIAFRWQQTADWHGEWQIRVWVWGFRRQNIILRYNTQKGLPTQSGHGYNESHGNTAPPSLGTINASVCMRTFSGWLHFSKGCALVISVFMMGLSYQSNQNVISLVFLWNEYVCARNVFPVSYHV